MARKTIQVDEAIHARFSMLWKKTGLDVKMNYGDSATGILTFLIDFYEKGRTSEHELALGLVKKIEERILKDYGQVDIYEAIKKAGEMSK